MCNHLFIHCTIFIPLLILKLVKNQNYILSVKQCYTGLRLLYIKGLMTKEVEEFPVVRTSITSDNSILSVYFYSDINRSRRLGSFLPLTAANVCKQIDAFLWSLKSAKRLNPNAFMDCKTLNVKYCLKCPTCGKHYIGRKKAQRTHKSPQTTDTRPICKNTHVKRRRIFNPKLNSK